MRSLRLLCFQILVSLNCYADVAADMKEVIGAEAIDRMCHTFRIKESQKDRENCRILAKKDTSEDKYRPMYTTEAFEFCIKYMDRNSSRTFSTLMDIPGDLGKCFEKIRGHEYTENLNQVCGVGVGTRNSITTDAERLNCVEAVTKIEIKGAVKVQSPEVEKLTKRVRDLEGALADIIIKKQSESESEEDGKRSPKKVEREEVPKSGSANVSK